jgi:hypothetical protein
MLFFKTKSYIPAVYLDECIAADTKITHVKLFQIILGETPTKFS